MEKEILRGVEEKDFHYKVTYIDDENRTHKAMVFNSDYLHYIINRFDVVECKPSGDAPRVVSESTDLTK